MDIKKSMLNGHKRIVSVLGCGGGKSVVQARIVAGCKSRVLFLVHRQELISQIKSTYSACGVDMSNCDFMMVQTYRRHLKAVDYYGLIIIDECHLNHKAYKDIVEHHTNAYVLGWTATPVRLSGGGLGEVYTDLVQGVSTRWLILHGYLADYKYYSVPLAETGGLHVKRGDYDAREVVDLMENDKIYGDAVAQWVKLAHNKKTIVYCASVEASRMTTKAFNCVGYACIHVDGSTPSAERTEAVERFRRGDVNILCNHSLFDVGFDVPDCECVVLLRPTMSLAVHTQQSMRCMRPHGDKVAIIIDHVGNVYNHGLPDDDRVWLLSSKKRQENTVKIKQCEECFSVYSPTSTKCPVCGSVTTIVRETTKRTTVDVDLVEIERKKQLKEMPMREFEASTWEQVIEYQKLKGYKFAWALRYAVSKGIKYPSKYNYMAKKYIFL